MPTSVDPLEKSGGNKLNALADRLVDVSEGLKTAIKNAAAQREAFLVAEQEEDVKGMQLCLTQFQREMSKFFDERTKMGKAGDKKEIEEIEDKMLDMKGEMNNAITIMKESGGGEGTMYIPLKDQSAERPRLEVKPPAPVAKPKEPAKKENKENPEDPAAVLRSLESKFQIILSDAKSRKIGNIGTGAMFSPFAAAEGAAQALFEALNSKAAKHSDHFRDELIGKFNVFVDACDTLSPGSGFGRIVKEEVQKPAYGKIKL